MLDIYSEELKRLLGVAEILRWQDKFEDAEKLLNEKINEMSDEAKQVVYSQLMYFSLQSGNINRAKYYAKELEKYDPNIPSVNKLLYSS